MKIPVQLYVPNILCYIRILLAFVGLYKSIENCAVSSSEEQQVGAVKVVCIWIASGLLDLVDGPLARILHQTSSLGVFLDIAADNILRSCVWIATVAVAISSTSGAMVGNIETLQFHPPKAATVSLAAAFLVSLEWSTMVATQVHISASTTTPNHWKEARSTDPWIVQRYFANNFRNPVGSLGIFGLFASNMLTYGSYYSIFHTSIPLYHVWMYLSYMGRALTAGIEVYLCCGYFAFTIARDQESSSSKDVVDEKKR